MVLPLNNEEVQKCFARHADAETQEFDWGISKWISDNCYNPAKCRVGVIFVLPGKSQPNHMHSNVDEFHYIVSGRGHYCLEGVSQAVEPGDFIVIPAGVRHYSVSSSDEPLQALTIKVKAD